ncbi:hypothetical protein WN944_027566 [Citrus x changshan-huyou]|uniref:AP2/ERF domain-containing protein n=1 Tax=Citrus x changshan-huyou TaxID=2935761 RepID=A0AAP0LP11_9ROSI
MAAAPNKPIAKRTAPETSLESRYEGVRKRPRGRFAAEIRDPFKSILAWLNKSMSPEDAARTNAAAAVRANAAIARATPPPPCVQTPPSRVQTPPPPRVLTPPRVHTPPSLGASVLPRPRPISSQYFYDLGGKWRVSLDWSGHQPRGQQH